MLAERFNERVRGLKEHFLDDKYLLKVGTCYIHIDLDVLLQIL